MAATGAPTLVMTYWNPVERYGVKRFADAMAAAGGAGVITPDLTPDEAQPWLDAVGPAGIDPVFLVAPSSTRERLERVAAVTRGFVYAASTMGVTGVRDQVATSAEDLVARVRVSTDLPVCVGLGVSTRAQAAEVAAYADGVIVGSAFVRLLLDAPTVGRRGAGGRRAGRRARRRLPPGTLGRLNSSDPACSQDWTLPGPGRGSSRRAGAGVALLVLSGLVSLTGCTSADMGARVAATTPLPTRGLARHHASPSRTPSPTSRSPTPRATRSGSPRDASRPVVLVVFGYTHCPWVCTRVLSDVATALRPLDPGTRSRVQVLFVTVDPDRDTPARLAAWLQRFDPTFIGLTRAARRRALARGGPRRPGDRPDLVHARTTPSCTARRWWASARTARRT